MKEITIMDLLKHNCIYRRVLVITSTALYEITTHDELFKECAENRLKSGFEYYNSWDMSVEKVLFLTDGYDCVYKEQYDYLKKYCVIMLMSIFSIDFEKLQKNQKQYRDIPKKIVTDFCQPLTDGIFEFDRLYKNNNGKIREDVPPIKMEGKVIEINKAPNFNF